MNIDVPESERERLAFRKRYSFFRENATKMLYESLFIVGVTGVVIGYSLNGCVGLLKNYAEKKAISQDKITPQIEFKMKELEKEFEQSPLDRQVEITARRIVEGFIDSNNYIDIVNKMNCNRDMYAEKGYVDLHGRIDIDATIDESAEQCKFSFERTTRLPYADIALNTKMNSKQAEAFVKAHRRK